jgi:predicted dehydrogenase
MTEAAANFSIPNERVYGDLAQCVREARPDLAILCPATARHPEVVEEVAAAVVDQPQGLEVDEHSITICRYARGLSKLETRWGTFTDPWTTQPQPKCGFVVVGSEGTISSYDYDTHVGVQTRSQPNVRQVPVDELKAPFRKPVEYCSFAGA